MHRLGIGLCLGVLCHIASARMEDESLYLARAKATTAAERTRISNLGIAIDGVFSDSIVFMATEKEIASVKQAGFSVSSQPVPERFVDDFPSGDAEFHNYQEMTAALDKLVQDYPLLVTKVTMGKSLEGRDLLGVRISSKPEVDSLPTAIFFGCHHAREHLSVEVPLRLAQYLLAGYATNERIRTLLDTREIYVLPMVNPDGAEHDIATGNYKYWRKNRRPNLDGSFGVDLNRNYAKGFGGEGSSATPSSDIYHGPSAFSEPETAAVRDFVRARSKATVLLSFHTFSELVLWPWGHTNEVIANETDRRVFEAMGNKMASWNSYTPQKSSELYVASGDTTDWAYDEKKIFAFTFELSPSSFFGGGFYPGAEAIRPTLEANIEPALYMIDLADNPYRVLQPNVDPLAMLH